MARPKNRCRTQMEANLIGVMADAGIHDYSHLAAKAKIDTATIQRICSGKMMPSVTTLLKIKSATGCMLDDLVEDLEEESEPTTKKLAEALGVSIDVVVTVPKSDTDPTEAAP